jgi:type 1 glutamine amidotransferase
VACDQGSAHAPRDLDARAPDARMSDAAPADADMRGAAPIRVLVFTRTLGFRHDSIAAAHGALRQLEPARFSFRFSEDPVELSALLPDTDVVAFVSTSGDVLAPQQEVELERFVRAGGGFVGVHAASDTEYDWPFYTSLIGAHFRAHPAVQRARVIVEQSGHPSTAFLPAVWERNDEWYDFDRNPRGAVEVLLRVDESSYTGGTFGADHPIAWSHTIDAGRSFYTALGHTEESWSEPLFVRHVEEALRWAAGREGAP